MATSTARGTATRTPGLTRLPADTPTRTACLAVPVAGRPRLQVIDGGRRGDRGRGHDGSRGRDGAPRRDVSHGRDGSHGGDSAHGRGGVLGGRSRLPQPVGVVRGSEVGRLKLTRRGRLVLRGGVVLLVVAITLLTVLVLSRPAAAGSGSRSMPVRSHVVLPGETLWSIAGEVAPRVDRRDTIARIVELNALPGSGVTAGQRIALPPAS